MEEPTDEARSVTGRQRKGSLAVARDSPAPRRQRESRSESRRAHVVLLVSTCAIGRVVFATAIIAVTLLSTTPVGTPWVPVLQEIVKVSYQALAVGALGGLAKLLLDRRRDREAPENERRRDREAQENELRERRHRYITIVVAASHQIDNAQMGMLANRSVLTWTTIVNNDLIPARTQLRELAHSLRNWTDAGRPVFGAREDVIADHLESMH